MAKVDSELIVGVARKWIAFRKEFVARSSNISRGDVQEFITRSNNLSHELMSALDITDPEIATAISEMGLNYSAVLNMPDKMR